jgi:hypothetical protein
MNAIRVLAYFLISGGIAAAQTGESISGIFHNELASDTLQASTTALSHKYAIAHFPYGGGWSTRLLLANDGPSDVTVDIAFFNGAGAPTSVPLEGQPGLQGSQQLVIHPNDVQVVGADPSERTAGSIQVAWATASASAPLNIFSLFDNGPSATTITGAVGTPVTAPAKTFRFPVSLHGPLGYNTGMALANPNGSATTVTVKLLNASGATMGSTQEKLPANGQTIFVLTDKISVDPSTLFNGSVAVCASQPIGMVAIGFEGGAFFATSVTNDPCP